MNHLNNSRFSEFESPEGKTIEFEKPRTQREGIARMMVYFDDVDLRVITETNNLRSAYICFVVHGKCNGMVSRKKYNRYFLTADTLLPMAIEIRDYYRKLSFTKAQMITQVSFNVGMRPDHR
jgi:hypothetical protein